MSAEIMIIWPQPMLANQLIAVLQRANDKLQPKLLTEYPDPTELKAVLRQDGDSLRALVVGMTDESRAADLLTAARELLPALTVIAADASESTSAIRAAMRAGAVDFWTPPFDQPEIVKSLSLLAQALDNQPAGKLLSFLPAQPGDGASTAALHACEAISANLGRPALLVDCDLHCGTLGFRLGLRPEYSLMDAAAHWETLNDLWGKVTAPWSNMRVLTAPESTSGLTSEHIAALPRIVEAALHRYPIVVADHPAAFSAAHGEVLLLSDSVCLACTPEVTSMYLARRRLRELEELGVKRSRIQLLVNRSDSRNAPELEDVERAVGLEHAWSLPNNYEGVSRAELNGCTVSRDTAFGEQIHRLAAGLAGFDAEKTRPSGWRRILSFTQG